MATPEDQNVHKREQLRQLASINGTFRDDEHQTSLNCGQLGHRQYSCPEPQEACGGCYMPPLSQQRPHCTGLPAEEGNGQHATMATGQNHRRLQSLGFDEGIGSRF